MGGDAPLRRMVPRGWRGALDPRRFVRNPPRTRTRPSRSRPLPDSSTNPASAPARGRRPASGREGGAADLPRPVAEFLGAFAMALHRFAMYPPGHPSLAPVAERMVLQLGGILGERAALTMGVTATQLLVEGAATPEAHPVLGDLARRLHQHQVGAIVFRKGASSVELTEVLRVLAVEHPRGERPLGLLPPQERPSWPNVHLVGVEYDALELADGGMGSAEPLSVRELWIALFRSAFRGIRMALGEEPGPEADGTPGSPGSARDPEELHAGGSLPTGREMADALVRWDARHPEGTPTGEGRRAEEVVGALVRLVGALQWKGEEEGSDLRLRTSELLREIQPGILARLLREGGASGARHTLLLRAARAGLSSDALLRVLDAVVAADDRTLSEPASTLVAKLARGGEGPAGPRRSEARSTLRDQLETVVSGWAGHPGRREPLWGADPSAERGEELSRASPLRVVEVALAVDAPGAALEAALEACLRRGSVAHVLMLAEAAPPESRAAVEVERYLLTPERLGLLLSGEDVDEDSLRRMVDVLGEEALDPLFSALAVSESRTVRRKIFDSLVAMGPRINQAILEYLGSGAWYVRRNMLALLQRMPVLPPGFSPLQHLRDEDERVRREALPLALRDPGSREGALLLALEDEDERVVRAALLELQSELPDSAIPIVQARFLAGELFPHLRSLVARALGGGRSVAARDALVRLCTAERGLLSRKPRLAPITPEVVSALDALARGWGDDPEIGWLLKEAGKSDDPRARIAVAGVGRPPEGEGVP
jgi:hypothetical protein